MKAISGTRRSIKELVDGTIRVQVDIDPRCRRDFFDLFPDIDMPVAIVPLDPQFEQGQAREEPAHPSHEPLGPLALLAVQWCRDRKFQEFVGWNWGDSPADEEKCRAIILELCRVGSRKDLDKLPGAAALFHSEFREPFMEWVGKAEAEAR